MTTVILTRPDHRIKEAEGLYQAANLTTLAMPCFAVQTNTEVGPEELALAERTPLLMILNSNAVKHTLLLKPDFTLSQQTMVIGVGTAVADYWQRHFDQPILTPVSQDSAGLIALLEHHQPTELVILTAAGGLDLVRRYCIEKQIHYRQINSYQRIPLPLDFASLEKLLEDDGNIVLTVTSGLILQHFWQQCPEDLKSLLQVQPVVCGATRITEIATDLGFHSVITADSPGNEDMLAACLKVAS